MKALNEACTNAETQRLKTLSPDLAKIKDQLAAADLTLFSDFSPMKSISLQEFGGEFVTLLLLSLGAPFWFNALRQLSNLKPGISRKVADERKQAEQTSGTTLEQGKAGASA
jgi:hypothetical protein